MNKNKRRKKEEENSKIIWGVQIYRVFNLKRSLAGAFAVPFRVSSRKKYDWR